jgi:tetratricopeptide (TPR) repeat protein
MRCGVEDTIGPERPPFENESFVAVTGGRMEDPVRRIERYEARLERDPPARNPEAWASKQLELAYLYDNFGTGDRNKDLQCAIKAYEAALRVLYGAKRANVQALLGRAYQELPWDDRTASLRSAIQAYEAALRDREAWGCEHHEMDLTVESLLLEKLKWAIVRFDLAIAYFELPAGHSPTSFCRALTALTRGLGKVEQSVLADRDVERDPAVAEGFRELKDRLLRSVELCEVCMTVFTAGTRPEEHTLARYLRRHALAFLGLLESDPEQPATAT